MWTWERERRREHREEPVQLGQMTLSGQTLAVNLGGERRELLVCAPGGLLWRPREGQQVLVLKGEAPCVLGTVEEQTDLKPGELRLPGDVTVDGEPLADLIRRIAAEVTSGA